MERIRFGIIGSGWRAEFYMRIAAAVPSLFELTGVVVRNLEKKVYLEGKYGAKVFLEKEALLKQSPDFVVVAISKPDIGPLLFELMLLQIPVLSETPPAVDEEYLNVLWNQKVQCGAKIQVAEQYHLYPMMQAKLQAVALGLLEEPYHVSASFAHDYHGMRLIRKFLGVGFENAVFCGDEFTFPVAETIDRNGICLEGKTVQRPWYRSTIVFEKGKTAFYDFSPVLYQSYIRSRHLTVMSRNGQIEDDEISYVDREGRVCKNQFLLQKDPFDEDCSMVLLGERVLYVNPFPKTRLTEDEIAMAHVLIDMKRYVETKEGADSFAEALQDTYLALKMKEAAAGHGKKVVTKTQPWAEKRTK